MENDLIIQHMTDEDVVYCYGSDKPQISLHTPCGWHTEYIDPWPCYSHPKELTEQTYDICTKAFPPQSPVRVFVLPFETHERWNGYCDLDYKWEDGVEYKDRKICVRIAMAGKRTPLHPAMTRYVCGHEYGHGVEKWLTRMLGYKEYTEFRTEYERWRGKGLNGEEYDKGYSARKWHKNLGELIANDFRILLAEIETEYWPHPEYPRPEKVEGLREKWLVWQKAAQAGYYKQ